MRSHSVSVLLLLTAAALLAGVVLGYREAMSRGPVVRALHTLLGGDTPRPHGSRPAELLFHQMPPGEVTMLGDSLTALGDWARLLPDVDVANHGIGGETSAGLRARLEGSEPVGRIAVVLIGINDASEGIDEDEATTICARSCTRCAGGA